MTAYCVTVTSKYPPAGERPATFYVDAPDKREAIELVRAQAEREGWFDRITGPGVFKATRDE